LAIANNQLKHLFEYTYFNANVKIIRLTVSGYFWYLSKITLLFNYALRYFYSQALKYYRNILFVQRFKINSKVIIKVFNLIKLNQFIFLTLALLCALFSLLSKAQQLAFTKKSQGNDYHFFYQWLDHDNEKQQISFALTKSALFERFRDFKSYQSEFAEKNILRNIKKKMRQQPIAGVQVSYRQKNGKYIIEMKGRDDLKVQQAYQQLSLLEQTVIKNYLTDNYYQQFITHDQISGIKVNHVDMANDSVADLKPLKPIILEKVSIKNIRKVSNYVLSFVQNIPYSTLESRLTSSGAGFNPPTKVLWENQGDCDSKMTLTAAILRALMPRIDMALIYIDAHAFIGIAIPAQGDEISINYQGVDYLLAEPTGPALLPLGRLAPESERAINQGRYVVENYHEVRPSAALSESYKKQ